ncbi:hypothetical protein MASR2M48_19670 [Spirochaetota bacterium]
MSSRDELELALKDYRSITSLRVATGNSAGAQYYNTAGKLAKPLATMALLAVQALLDERRAASLNLLYDFVVEAAEARASSATLSFSDVSAIALKTLETDTVLRDWYTSRYDAIMVDEFQDDNDLQKRILYCLAERRKGRTEETGSDTHTKVGVANLEPGVLFFVGDEKQSIYAFRGADVTVFRGLSSELSGAPGGLGMHSLDINWRSEPGLIDFFNRTFSAVLPSPDDPFAKDYEARFAGLEAGPATLGVEPSVVYLESNEPDDDSMLSSGEAESWRIAELVRSLVGDGTIISAKGPDGGKVARACRCDEYSPYCSNRRLARISWNGISGCLVFHTPPPPPQASLPSQSWVTSMPCSGWRSIQTTGWPLQASCADPWRGCLMTASLPPCLQAPVALTASWV